MNPKQRSRGRLAVGAGSLLLAAALLSVVGLAWAVPGGLDSADRSMSGLASADRAPALGPNWSGANPASPGHTADELGPTLPAPDPVAVRADEVREWIANATSGMRVSQEDPWAAIDACVLADMAGDESTPLDDTPGASIAVAVNGVITYTKGYGVKVPGGSEPVDAQTLFRIGSTTKMMTAAAIMNLAEDGKVDVSAPLTTYLPDYRLGYPWDSADLTLDILMSHQSGMIDQYFVNDPNISLADWVAATGAYSLPLYAAPGSYWNYANPNFSLAGAVVERVSGMPYAAYMSGTIWDPNGMPLSTIDPTEVISTGNYTVGWHNGRPVEPGSFDYPMLAPAGTAYSTPSELVTWALSMQSSTPGVLNVASRQAMQARRMPTDYVPWMDYGYGIFVTDWRDVANPDQRVVVYDHGGNINGGSSQLYWIPERGVAVSILASTIRSLGNAAACAVQTLAGIEPIPTSGLKTEPETWDAFTGTYSMMDLFRWPWTGSVSRVTQTLTLAFPDIYGSPMLEGESMPFYYAYADIFVPLADSMLLGPNAVDMSFIRDREDPVRARFMRNRNLVGERVGDFPERVQVTGDACAPVRFTSGRDMPVLRVEASGLVTPTRLVSVPLTADNPSDPSSTSFRHDFHVGPGGAKMVYALTTTAPDDAVVPLLLHDANADGTFAFPGEVVADGYYDMGQSMLYVPTSLPEGDYQLWLWALVVNGESSELNLDLTVMQGSNLRLENVPRGLADGAEWEMRVCAEGRDGVDEAMTGMIQFSYDSPPRLFRVMVDWSPATEGPPTIHLPWVNKPPAD